MRNNIAFDPIRKCDCHRTGAFRRMQYLNCTYDTDGKRETHKAINGSMRSMRITGDRDATHKCNRADNKQLEYHFVLVKEKTNEVRIRQDSRQINNITPTDIYPFCHIQSLLALLNISAIVNSINFVAGYHQIKMDGKDSKKTAFSCRKLMSITHIKVCHMARKTFHRII